MVSIVGGDGQVYGGDDAAAHMLVGLAEEGMVPAEHIVGQLLPRLPALRSNPRTASLVPRVQALASRVSPSLMATLGRALGQGVAGATEAHVEQSPFGPLRDVTQGLDSGAVLIAAGATFNLQFNASMPFRPERLIVGPSIAPFWVVEDIKVAADSLFLQTGPVPAEAFLQNADEAPKLKRRTANAGTPITIPVTNIDVVAHRFRAGIFGKATDNGSC